MRVLMLIGSAAALLVGCATSNKTFAPDGREAYALNCSGAGLSWGDCMQKAGEICGARGYDLLSQTGDRGSIASFAPTSGLFAGSIITRNALIACKS